MTFQQQQERTIEQPQTRVQESVLLAFYREVVLDNPVYRREATAVIAPANYSPEKAEAFREKARKKHQEWAALPPHQRIWRTIRGQVIFFAICYTLLPLVLPIFEGGKFWPGMIGPLCSGLFAVSASTAGSIVGEREKRTWNALLLSRLTPAQILGGKVANVLRTLLTGQSILLAFALALVFRGVMPVAVLLLFPLVLVPSALLGTLVGIQTSLWGKSLKAAMPKATWRGMGLGFLALGTIAVSLLALFGKLPAVLLLTPLVYAFLTLVSSVRIWRRMLRDLWRAPKDFSG